MPITDYLIKDIQLDDQCNGFIDDYLLQMVTDHYYPRASRCDLPDFPTIIEPILGLRSDGIFVEVGANDGHNSNCCGLADIGWQGVYIEPIADYALVCKLRHSRNTVMVWNLAVGAMDSPLELHIASNNAESSSALTVGHEFIKANHNVTFDKKITVQQYRLDAILEASQIQPDFDLLVVDVEGMEPEVFAGFNIEYYRPKVLLVELWDVIAGHPLEARHAEVRDYLQGRGYRQHLVQGYNTVFVRGDL
ncbi:MAG: FkbM family methyltransferase [Candidatus Pacebacteria bacterium]|nr:FkbM family methyltransferase [Candidatus Paceibacterota bacterium]